MRRLIAVTVITLGLLAACAPATATTEQRPARATACTAPTWPYSVPEVHRWWNCGHDPNIDRPAAVRVKAWLDAVVTAKLRAYAFAVWLAALERARADQRADLVWRWSGVAQCESGGNWAINTGNGYYGGLQFLLSTWRSVGGQGYPHQATPGEQAYRAEILRQRAGLGQWPVCGRFYR